MQIYSLKEVIKDINKTIDIKFEIEEEPDRKRFFISTFSRWLYQSTLFGAYTVNTPDSATIGDRLKILLDNYISSCSVPVFDVNKIPKDTDYAIIASNNYKDYKVIKAVTVKNKRNHTSVDVEFLKIPEIVEDIKKNEGYPSVIVIMLNIGYVISAIDYTFY
jgi:hypothetical protein